MGVGSSTWDHWSISPPPHLQVENRPSFVKLRFLTTLQGDGGTGTLLYCAYPENRLTGVVGTARTPVGIFGEEPIRGSIS